MKRERLDVPEPRARARLGELRRRMLAALLAERRRVVEEVRRRLRRVRVDGLAQLERARCELVGERTDLVRPHALQLFAQLGEQVARGPGLDLALCEPVRALDVVEPVPARDGEAPAVAEQPPRLGEQRVVVRQVLDQPHRGDRVERTRLEAGLVERRDDELDVQTLGRRPRLLDHARRDVDADRAPAELRRVRDELAAAAPEVDERAAVGQRRRDSLDREPHALRPDRKPRAARVRGRDPRLRVPVEVLPHIILHGAKLASSAA
jgi:hypothetical protein